MGSNNDVQNPQVYSQKPQDAYVHSQTGRKEKGKVESGIR
jgi:hypothetical protein